MIDITIQFLLQTIDIIPYLIPLVLVINLCSDLIFGK